MKNVTIPSQFLQELLALCGPEDHELRERVLKSAAPTHPAEGVPAQEVQAAIDRFDAYFRSANGVPPNARVTVPTAEWQELRAMLSTHPTQQGMDAQRWQIVRQHISAEYSAGHACFVVRIEPVHGENIMRGSVAQHFTKAVDDRAKQIKIAHQAWLAAQAKQGGV